MLFSQEQRHRKPLSFASVAITLDNSVTISCQWSYNEVTVTRRLYRSGESEYLINGSACRLKDINEMFYDTGIGKEGYSIIGQGQIDKILSGKPEERRELFDEAAGIVKYKRRKNTTIKKLEDEQQNLVRVTDILSELTKQLGPLERQSETARIYLAKRDSLRELDVNMFLLESQQTEKDLLVLREKNETASAQLEDTNREYQHTKVEYDRLEQELEELNRQMDELREKTQQNALQKQQLEGQINVLNEQIQAGLQSDTHFKNRLEIVEEDLKQRQQARSEVEEEKESLHTIVKEAQKRLTDQEDRLHTVQEQISQCESAVEDGKNEIIEILNSRATTKGKAQRFDTLMEQVGIRKAEVNQHILHLKSEEAQQKTIRAKAQSEYDQITEEIHQIDQKSRQMDQQVHSLSEDLKKQTTQLEISQTAYHREASRLESLRNITERYDGYGNSIRRVMEQKEPGIRHPWCGSRSDPG